MLVKQQDKWNKELTRLSIANFKETDNMLFNHYKEALRMMKIEIKSYVDNYENLSFSKRLEVERQLQVANRIDNILLDLNQLSESDIRKNIEKEIEVGYYGTWYALESAERIQLDFAMLPEKYIEELVNKPVNGMRFSERLYKRRNGLANNVTASLIQGAASGKGYRKIAKEIGELTEANYKQALRIARTEGGRAQSIAKQRSYQEAKDKGVRIQKRWLATLDKKTRHQHQILDGKTVEIEEPFEFEGNKADGPRLFGVAGLDIDCRCTTVTVVNGISPELRKDNENKEIIKYNNYEEWAASKGYEQREAKIRTKKISIAEAMAKTNMKDNVGKDNYDEFSNRLNNIQNERVKSLFDRFGDQMSFGKLKNSRAYANGSFIQLSQEAFDGRKSNSPLQTVFHEIGHAFDSIGLKKVTGSERVPTGNVIKKKILRRMVDVEETVSHISGLPKYRLKDTINRDIWEYVNGKDLPSFEDLGPKPRKKAEKEAWEEKRSEIFRTSRDNFEKFEKDMIAKYGKGTKAISVLSDIYESTPHCESSLPFGSGHGKTYYKDVGKAETEFFAHMVGITTTNDESYAVVNEIFPNAVKTWENIVDDMLKASD